MRLLGIMKGRPVEDGAAFRMAADLRPQGAAAV